LLNFSPPNDLGQTLGVLANAPIFSNCNTMGFNEVVHNQCMLPAQPSHRLDQIAQARRAVIDGDGHSAAQYVQPWVSQSWQRCLSAGRRPDDALVFDYVSHVAQKRSKDENHALRLAARATLDQLSQAIAQTKYFAILTNAQGEVVDTGGAIDRSDPRADLITRIGVDLSETAVGTTAIGATLAEQRSTWLHRGEHFFQDTQWYSCAGAPIIGPDGQCAGMVDVTGIEVPERPELMSLVARSARAIENALVKAQPHALVLHLQWPGQHGGKDNEGLVCVDADGVIGAMNPIARQMLGLLQASPVALHTNDVFAISTGHLFDAQRKNQWINTPLWSGLHLQARVSVSGWLSPKSHGNPMSKPMGYVQPLKDSETALIKHTVSLLKGNVAAAAEQLGISRSTIYRKLGKPKT
jgi:sigma-54 dependent transcriptional regulator, acetoin dehydrogenase operon transcriptional activator AcoR